MQLSIHRNMIHMHNGASAHFVRNAEEWLDKYSLNTSIGRGDSIIWSVRFPDLNLLDFILWGFVKEKVGRTSHDTHEARGRINAVKLLI
ncbi:hypothetical protein Trydic_g19019 [Trypoxylus dichotomus]